MRKPSGSPVAFTPYADGFTPGEAQRHRRRADGRVHFTEPLEAEIECYGPERLGSARISRSVAA